MPGEFVGPISGLVLRPQAFGSMDSGHLASFSRKYSTFFSDTCTYCNNLEQLDWFDCSCYSGLRVEGEDIRTYTVRTISNFGTVL